MCMLMNARKAARAVSRRYDRLVRPFGLKAGQFSVLVAVRSGKGMTTTAVAEALGMDRTTLVRNLALLEKQGFVRGAAVERGNGRTYVLTDSGARIFDEALPIWREAQADLAAELGVEQFEDIVSAMKRLSVVG